MRTNDEFLSDVADYGDVCVSPGICAACPDCQEFYELPEAKLTAGLQDGSIADEPHFSRYPCETCGDIAGDRYEAHYLDDCGIVHLNICPDCVCYFANGDLPNHV